MKDFITWMLVGVALAFMPTRALAQGASMAAVVNSPPAAAGGVTWTVVQHPSKYTCSYGSGFTSATCTISGITSTTAGNLLLLMFSAFNNGNLTTVYSSASGDGTWTHPSSTHSAQLNGTSYEDADCAYILSATGGATSVSITVNSHNGAGNLDVEFFEVHRSTGAATFDTGNATGNASCTSCSGPSLTLTGTDFVASWVGAEETLTGPGSPYTNPIDIDTTNVFGGYAGALNQSSYSIPVWQTSVANGIALSSVAFK